MEEQKAQNIKKQIKPDPYKPSLFLLKKRMPATEAEFFNAYGITRTKAGELLIILKKHIQTINPAIQINHETAWTKNNLEKLFSFAGHNYEQLIKNINNYTFKSFSPNQCIAEICREFISNIPLRIKK